ncbi:cobalamin-binding protein [bacterium]|nr:cobalamin-binding protein [bacterium]
MRIVSLLPSATEIICEIGLGESLVGVTHECDYPEWVSRLPKVTTTLIPLDATSRQIDDLVGARLKDQQSLYGLQLDVLENLAPDLIVTQALCDVCAVAETEVQAAACQLPGRPRVINLEPTTLEEVLMSCIEVGRAAGQVDSAIQAVEALRNRAARISNCTARIQNRPRVVVLEWIDPLFSSGHWTPELIEMAGGREMIGKTGEKSRRITWQDVLDARPEVLLIACCGYSLERTKDDASKLQQLPGWSELPAVNHKRVYVTDGNAYFSRPGPRLIDSLEIAVHAIHPEMCSVSSSIVHATRQLIW